MYTVSVVMEAGGLHGDVRVKGVLVEDDSATGVMRNVKVVRERHVLKVLIRFLICNHVPFSCSVFFNGTFSASSRSRMPAQYAVACLLKQTVGHVLVETVFRFRGREPSVVGTAENRFGAS